MKTKITALGSLVVLCLAACSARAAMAVLDDSRYDGGPMHGDNQASPCAVPPADMISWWPAEGAGTDVSGTNNAYLINGATYGPGEVGQGFSLDGVDDRIVVSNSPSLNFGPANDFSIERWIKAFPPTNNPLGVMSIVEKRLILNVQAAIGYALFLDGGRLSCQIDPAPGNGFHNFIAPGTIC